MGLKSVNNHVLIMGMCAAILVCAPVWAKPGYERPRGFNKFLQLFDANRDGKVDQTEFSKASRVRFHKMDANGDGKVSYKELLAYITQRRMAHRLRIFHRIDKNRDNHVSLHEYLELQRKRAVRRFHRMDRNRDGRISRAELLNPPRNRFFRRRQAFVRHLFKRLDKNADGAVSESESLKAWSNWFKRLDKNGDRLVTVEDLGSQ